MTRLPVLDSDAYTKRDDKLDLVPIAALQGARLAERASRGETKEGVARRRVSEVAAVCVAAVAIAWQLSASSIRERARQVEEQSGVSSRQPPTTVREYATGSLESAAIISAAIVDLVCRADESCEDDECRA